MVKDRTRTKDRTMIKGQMTMTKGARASLVLDLDLAGLEIGNQGHLLVMMADTGQGLALEDHGTASKDRDLAEPVNEGQDLALRNQDIEDLDLALAKLEDVTKESLAAGQDRSPLVHRVTTTLMMIVREAREKAREETRIKIKIKTKTTTRAGARAKAKANHNSVLARWRFNLLVCMLNVISYR